MGVHKPSFSAHIALLHILSNLLRIIIDRLHRREAKPLALDPSLLHALEL